MSEMKDTKVNMESPYTYESERLLFRPWTIEDAEECFGLSSDELVGPMCGWMPHESLEETRSILTNILINDHTYAIIQKETSKIIGNMGIDYVYDDEDNPVENLREIGFWLGRPYWNQGYMTEAVKRTIEFCRDQLGVRKLKCCYFTGNDQSARVQEKCGFKHKETKMVFWKALNEEKELNENELRLV